MTDPATNATIDYSALGQPADSATVASYRSAARTAGYPWARASLSGGAIGQLVILGLAGLGFLLISGLFIPAALFSVGSAMEETLALLVPGIIMLGVVVLIGSLGYRVIRAELPGWGAWQRWTRLDAFAKANGFRFSPLDPNPAYPGSIFGLGDSRYEFDHFVRPSGRFLDIGNYRYITGSGKSRQTHSWGFMALRLDRKLPNMVLDAKSNNQLFGSTNLPMAFAHDQVLALEGDFDKYFTLYCPQEYERDALYVFTPDLMALLIDQTQQFDVEIVDDWMFVYAAKPLNVSDIPTLNHLFRIVDTVGAKTVDQTDRYSDDRVASPALNMVAPEGQRLKRRVPIISTILVVLAFAYWLYSFIGGFIPGLPLT